MVVFCLFPCSNRKLLLHQRFSNFSLLGFILLFTGAFVIIFLKIENDYYYYSQKFTSINNNARLIHFIPDIISYPLRSSTPRRKEPISDNIGNALAVFVYKIPQMPPIFFQHIILCPDITTIITVIFSQTLAKSRSDVIQTVVKVIHIVCKPFARG